VREQLNLNDPFVVQYLKWLEGAVRLNFGRSLINSEPVSTQLASRIPVTLGLALVAFAITIPVTFVLGVISGLRPKSLADKGILFFTSAAVSMPTFWVGLLLVSVFAVELRWLPPVGYVPFRDDPVGWLRSIILPATALSILMMATLTRQVRAGLTDVMNLAYIRTAWVKGGSARQVVVGHALKNSAIPAVTVLGLQAAAVMGSTVLVEQIFAIPGLGPYMLQAVTAKDVPVIQAVSMVFVLVTVVVNLLVDVAYGYLNPKVRG
jgi:peptide/nickel transport system permease protein